MLLEKAWTYLFLTNYVSIVGQTALSFFGKATILEERKLLIQTSFIPGKNWPCVASCLLGEKLENKWLENIWNQFILPM